MPLPLIPLVAMGVSAVASLVGNLLKGGKDAEAAQIMEQARQEFGNDPKAWGELNAAVQGGTEFDKISTDPRLRQQQMASMSALDDISKSGGLRLEDQAQLNEIQNANAQREHSAHDAIGQNMQMRGMGGSGFELAQNLAAQQGAANRNADQSLNVAGMAQKRALDSIVANGQLGGQIRSQDFGEASQRAKAQDEINRYNTNAANTFALGNRQAAQQRAVGMVNAAGNQASVKAGQGASIATGLNQAGQGIAQAGGAYGAYQEDQERKKRNGGV